MSLSGSNVMGSLIIMPVLFPVQQWKSSVQWCAFPLRSNIRYINKIMNIHLYIHEDNKQEILWHSFSFNVEEKLAVWILWNEWRTVYMLLEFSENWNRDTTLDISKFDWSLAKFEILIFHCIYKGTFNSFKKRR